MNLNFVAAADDVKAVIAEVAKDVVMTRATFRCAHTDGHATVSDALLDELAEALKREEGKR